MLRVILPSQEKIIYKQDIASRKTWSFLVVVLETRDHKT